ncbi:TetR family transcriptional regulator [Effusibacillus lacus]|uniref:TetR family transcriptional regulator n=1 Tax=Effusibacillus lacus TaxID=1348429 RepID=A0A292YI65_9BACL|nr:TetR family transcriptional regulator [Effusibacillus lacus]TCS74716.1 TetR family transcriptional regulator [Effusibacillus lacus]GAX88529.1 TetR family transcriptional regulator [Effusibacillus lacus]
MDTDPKDVKLRILLAAKKLFAKNGFEGTTVRQICEEAGANVALVSYHFGGKENVFYALIDTFFPGKKLHEHEEQLQDPVKGIKFLIAETIRFRMLDPELARIMQQEVFMESPRLERIMQYALPIWRRLGELLDKGREQGIFHFRSTTHTVLLIISTLVLPNSNRIHLELTQGEEQPLEKRVEDTTRFILGGLGYQYVNGGDKE